MLLDEETADGALRALLQAGRCGRRRCGGRRRRNGGGGGRCGCGPGPVFATARDDVIAAIGLSLDPTANDSAADAAALRRRAASHGTACTPQCLRGAPGAATTAAPGVASTATPASATAGRPGGQLCLLELG